jgi:hypothetical protein
MSETAADASTTSAPEPAPEEWKPEPRKWVWKDLFTAPMLAFKPKCMLVSAFTIALLTAFGWAWGALLGIKTGDWSTVADLYVVGPVLTYIGWIIKGIIFSLGATFVAVFMKADLLDDEFLSLGEAIGQFKKRVVPAIMVPTFLVTTVCGFLLLIYLGMLLCSIPYVGSIFYMLLYPFAYLLALLTVLVAVAVTLSYFLYPSIVAIRKHGWFDNVIDTFEAVGTKPHVVVLNIVLTKVLLTVALLIAFGGVILLSAYQGVGEVPGREVARVDNASTGIAYNVIVEPLLAGLGMGNGFLPITAMAEGSGYHAWFTGLVTSFWKIPLFILFIGYAFNVWVAGGMLTYLTVREDDYWDDEDLEDLDKLAKELEEEAKAEAAAASEAKDEAPKAEKADEEKDAEKTEAASEEKSDESDKAEEASDDKPAESAEEQSESSDSSDDSDGEVKKD